MQIHLKELESLLYRLITAPSGVAEGLATECDLPEGGLASIIVGDERLTADERVEIYANMYFYRLLDVLREDFPATAKALGDVNFHNVVTGYLLEHPPNEPSVVKCGDFLPGHLRQHPLCVEFPWIADLARLERATIDVFLSPDCPVFDTAAARVIPPDRWPALELRAAPSVQILALEWDVAKVLRAVEDGQDWVAASRRDCRVLVWRLNSRVFYRELGSVEARALAALSRGAKFAQICELVALEAGPDPPATIANFVQIWVTDGIVARDDRHGKMRQTRSGSSASSRDARNFR
jgi:hypothetical protein